MNPVILVTLFSTTSAFRSFMDPKTLGEAQHASGDTMAEDWGQEYGPKQFQWRKEEPSHAMDNFDRDVARDSSSPFDKKNPLPGAPAGAPGAAPAGPSGPAGAPMDPKLLGDAAHKSGDTMGEDWGQEYGPKQFQWRKDKPSHGLDAFDKNLVKDGASPAAAPAR